MASPLDEYSRKRDFTATPEPRGARLPHQQSAQVLHYVIQKHAARQLHYDFRLELDGTLKSWAVPKGPCLDPKVKRLAVQVEDHPLDYAAFEGRIPEGHYGAGEVIVWDRGTWAPLDDPRAGYAQGRLKFELQGEKLSGIWNLVRTAMVGKKAQWFLIKSRDEQARDLDAFDILDAQPGSVLSDHSLTPREPVPTLAATTQRPSRRRSLEPVQSGAGGALVGEMPQQLSPQLATLVERQPEGNWRYEIKFDGYRLLTRIRGEDVRLFTRTGQDWTARMPELVQALADLGLESAWLDGEILVENPDGQASFQHLQNAFEQDKSEAIHYYLFDLPYLNGVDLRQVALEERRAALSTVLTGHPDSRLRFSQDFDENPEHLLGSACQMKFEGLIGKRCGSPYTSRRSTDWIKLKCRQRQEFVIVGYTEPQGARAGFGALLLGLHEAHSGQLRYAGKVGTGFREQSLRSLHAGLAPLRRKTPAIVNPPRGIEARGVHWLTPERVCEVAYAEMTRDGVVRHAVFQGLREDKPAEAVTGEGLQRLGNIAISAAGSSGTKQPAALQSSATARVQTTGTGQLKITHPQRIIDPVSGITKLELAEYYARIAPWALPWLEGRPVALVRGPAGIAGELFFQRHADKQAIPQLTLLDPAFDPDHAPLMVIDSPEALVGAAQMGTLELHTWNARLPNLEKPDRFILDLDPDPELPWGRMIEATQLTQTLLDELGLVSFLKTSGGRGMHVIVPLSRRQGWASVKTFTQAIAQHMANLMPERFTAVAGPRNRIGKVFIDYLRNSRGASTVSPYSARAREGLPVSVPIHRYELATLAGANTWDVRNLLPRLERLGQDDPWATLPGIRQSISVAMRKRLARKT
ncbi:MAG: DNA ligase D [Pseudomonadota bacterium]